MPETATIISAVSIIVVILATVLAVRLFPDYAPDLNLTFPTPEGDFNQAVFMLASGKSKNVTYHGNTLPLVNTKKTLKKCYKILSKRVAGGEELNIYETSLYNDYYKIRQYATAVSENLRAPLNLPRVNGNLRIYELAQLTVRFHGGQISEEIVKTAFDRYNRVTTLTHAETTNFPLVVRFCLIEYLTAIALRVINQARYVRQAKNDATYGKFHPSLVFSPAYLTAFYAYASENGKIRADKVCQDNGISLVKAIDERAKLDRIYEKLVENTVKSVYALDKILSPKLMQSLDAVNIILEEIPSYRDNSLRTKDYLCARVAMLAKKRKKSETAIASETVGRAFSSGINACEILLPTRKNKWSQRLYILIQILTSVILTTAVTFILPPPRLLFSIPVSFIVFTTAVKLTDHLVLKLKKERFVPDIDENKVKSSALVTKVCVISTPEDAKRAIFDLKTTACANRDKNLCYALLADLPTAKIKESEIDQKIVTAISNEFATLDQTRFNIFVRKRVKSGDQYHGFERKRGALMALNSLILRNDSGEFLLVLGKSYHHKYVITLDSDTVISRAHRLIGFMEHPLAKFTAVMSVKAVTLPSSRNKTIFSSVFADGDYHDNYAYRHDDAHFALFNEGNFTGKGIYNVEKFDAKLRGFFPRGRILSHDYIEGAVVGCANSPVKAYDETPSNFSAYLSRKLRWTRGDWQLLSYTFNKVKNEQGNTVKNPINPINKWRIALNMNFGLEPLFSLVLLFLSAISGRIILTIFALLPYILPLVLSLKWLTKSKIIPLTLINLITLPATAITLTKGIIVTLFRLISGKNLLSWTISSKDKGKNDHGIEQMLTALILVIINLFTGNNPLVYALASLFSIGLPVIKLTGEKAKNKPLDSKIYGYYYLIAERTWRFYSESVVGSVNFLPPDNYDEREDKGYAYRTSPTNIGMYLTSVYCAYHLGLIDKAVATARIYDTLKTVEKMEKFRGHLYNWYDIKSLAPLPPRYVSFVDSGNFLCALVLVSEIAGDESRAIINKTIKSTDFNFLYDKKVGLCRIGYNTTTASFDGHYDLTASESLISYLICVAFNLLPASTLDNLSTKCYYDCGNTLCSWTGGAFEYLLCPLFFRYEKETMLYSSALNSIKSQKKLAKKCGNKFWGISECQYREKEDNGDYRYKAFGVDAISLCPDTQSTAISMYGGVLGLGFDKESENLIERYIEENLLGKYGLYESYDHGAIKTYMAHHQGMIMLALTNALKNNQIIKSMRAHPEICSLDTYLARPETCERAKRKVKIKAQKTKCSYEKTIAPNLAYDEYIIYNCGNYNMLISSSGRGYSMLGKTELIRKRKGTGMLVFAKTDEFSLDLTLGSRAKFTARGASYIKENNIIKSEVVVYTIASGQGGEVRKVTLANKTDAPIKISLSCIVEPTLTNHDSDLAHREFSNFGIMSSSSKSGAWAKRNDNNSVIYLRAVTDNFVSYATSRAQFYDRRKAYDSPYQLDTALEASVDIELNSKQSEEVIFVLCAVDSAVFCDKYMDKILQKSDLINYGENPMISKINSLVTAIENASGSTVDSGLVNHFDTRFPTVMVKVYSLRSNQSVADALQSLTAVARGGVRFNLALLYNEPSGYFTPVEEMIKTQIERSKIKEYISGGAIKLVNYSTNEELYTAVERNAVEPKLNNYPVLIPLLSTPKIYPLAPMQAEELAEKQGYGGFTKQGDYYMDISGALPPKPWSNILSNDDFGSVTSESGGGYTFANSRLNKITDFSNDSTLDEPSEFVLLSTQNEAWSITKNPVKKRANYDVLFGYNETRYRANYNGILSSLTHKIGLGKTKYYKVDLTDFSGVDRKIKIALAVKFCLGESEEYTRHALVKRVENNRIYVTNSTTNTTAFIDCSMPLYDYAFSLKACQKASGEICKFDSLDKSIKASETVYVTQVNLPANNSVSLCFALSQNEQMDISNYATFFAKNEKRRGTLSPVFIENGLNSLKNLYAWLPVQVINSRIKSKCGFYQASGAVGFRDQLQDGMAGVYFNREKTKNHIIKCASTQFNNGDVLHWFFDDYTGVRSNYSDDKLFLVWATVDYINYTGDKEILDIFVPYLDGENSDFNRYKKFNQSSLSEPLLSHLIRAIDSVKYGENSLALIEGGDWNDGMSGIGKNGKGESVFTTMLAYYCTRKILPYISGEKKNEYAKLSVELAQNVNRFFFDGYYARAVLPNGEILGTNDSEFCKIDLLTQAFAVISGVAPIERAKSAIEIAYNRLRDENSKTLNLLAPPFTAINEKIGYITKYPPFVRENGGQYTHATLWFVKACFMVGKTELGNKILDELNPVLRTKTEKGVEKYQAEPFVLCADIYGGNYLGAGGWSWYTGSGAWAYKIITEEVLGVKFYGDTIKFNPHIKADEKRVEIKITHPKATIKVVIDNAQSSGKWTVFWDKINFNSNQVKLSGALNGATLTVKKI